MATAGVIPDQKLEKQIQKQMGCMTGFLQLFDRQHILTGKRLCSSTRRLPSTTSSSVDSSPQSEKSSIDSPVFSKELPQSQPEIKKSTTELRSPASEFSVPVEIPVKIISSSPLPSPLPAFDPKESLRTPWKLREGPRLSLDSRASFDTKGSLYPKEIKSNAAIFSSASRCESFESNNENENNQKRGGGGSPSVIARLMGLEGLPNSSGREPIKKVELTRSASESRVSRDFQYRFIEPKHSEFSNSVSKDNVVVTEDYRSKLLRKTTETVGKPKSEQQKISNVNGFYTGLPWNNNHNSNQNHQHQMQQRKMFYDAQDFFPEPKQNGTTLYGEIEKRLKMRGIDEPEKDLETLKQILEALQLKGLLHSSSNRKQPVERIGNRNFVFDRRFSSTEESPIVIMKPSRSSQFNYRNGRTGQESTSSPTSNIRSRANGINRNINVSTDSGRTRMNRHENEPQQRNSNGINNRRGRNSMSSSPDRNESPARSPSSLARRKALSIETPRRGNNNEDQNRRSSPVNSPRVSPRRGPGSDQFTNRSPRNNRKSDSSPRERISVRVIDDESSAFSESSISTSSQFDFSERSKMEEYKDERSLLERCDKLLHSIAEITSTETELQPSPVSVLDSSFYKDESSPSPIMRRARCIDFKDQSADLEEDMWSSPVISPIRMKSEENIQSDDSDFIYISAILQVPDCLSEDTDVFLLLEKQKYKTTSQVSRVHRKLVFDTITEILDRKRQLPPWKTMSSTGKPSFRQIWMEFRRIREKATTEDLFEIICGALKKDMVGDSTQGWVDCPLETSEAVLDIERLIFKDLIADVIKDLADSTNNNLLVPSLRRTLVF